MTKRIENGRIADQRLFDQLSPGERIIWGTLWVAAKYGITTVGEKIDRLPLYCAYWTMTGDDSHEGRIQGEIQYGPHWKVPENEDTQETEMGKFELLDEGVKIIQELKSQSLDEGWPTERLTSVRRFDFFGEVYKGLAVDISVSLKPSGRWGRKIFLDGARVSGKKCAEILKDRGAKILMNDQRSINWPAQIHHMMMKTGKYWFQVEGAGAVYNSVSPFDALPALPALEVMT
jgi:hypothetical protein